MAIRGIPALLIGALFLSGCATAYEPPIEETLQILQRLKTAQLNDTLLAEDLSETLNKDLRAKTVKVSRSDGYSRTVLVGIPGFETQGSRGPAEVIVERWDLAEGPAVDVTFRTRSLGPSAAQVLELFKDYTPRYQYGSHIRVPVIFHCSNQQTDRTMRLGVTAFGVLPEEYSFVSRRMPGKFGNVGNPTSEILAQASAPWTVSPNARAVDYPERAMRLERQGTVRLMCRVTPLGKLEDCAVQREQPAGLEFAAKAMSWSEIALLQTDGASRRDAAEPVTIDLTFRVGWTEEVCPALNDTSSSVASGK